MSKKASIGILLLIIVGVGIFLYLRKKGLAEQTVLEDYGESAAKEAGPVFGLEWWRKNFERLKQQRIEWYQPQQDQIVEPEEDQIYTGYIPRPTGEISLPDPDKQIENARKAPYIPIPLLDWPRF